MGEPLLAQALRLLEEGRDREALVFLQPPQEGLPEAERLALLGFAAGRGGPSGLPRLDAPMWD